MYFASSATRLRLESFVIFTPTVKLDETINIKFCQDKSLISDLNRSKNQIKQHINHKKDLDKSIEEINKQNQ
jgi:hypothetical protein